MGQDRTGKQQTAGPLASVQNMSQYQQILLLLGILIALMIWVWHTERRNGQAHVVAWEQLKPQSALELTKNLQNAKIPFQLQNDNTVVTVPRAQVDAAVTTMAMQGLPRNGVVSDEIFKDFLSEVMLKDAKARNLTLADFQGSMNRVNLQRAVEGELTRLVHKFDGVEDAAVKLFVLELPMSGKQEERLKAAAMITFTPGNKTNEATLKAIVHLLAICIPVLEKSHIPIFDESGVALNDGVLFDKPITLSPQQRLNDAKFALKVKIQTRAPDNFTLYYILGGVGAVVLLALLLRPKVEEEQGAQKAVKS